MKRARTDYRFVDLEAREGDGKDDDEDEEEGADGAPCQIQVYNNPSNGRLLDGFLEGDTVVESQHTPTGPMLPNDVEENSNRGGWTSLVASIEQRYASGGGTIHRIAEHLGIEPAIAAAIDNITCQPTDGDYPLWAFRCKVTPPRYHPSMMFTYV